jgi:hypothetical protein
MPQPLSTILNGQRFYPNELLSVPRNEEIERSWKERLFSWPWQPFKKTKYVTKWVASDEIICFNGTYYAHPDTIEKIKAAIENRNATCRNSP